MTAQIRAKRTTYDVYGQLKDVAPILAWIADQAPSACVKFDDEGGSQRMIQWFEFEVWFEDDTDEVNFKMFQSEAFEAQVEYERDGDVAFYKNALRSMMTTGQAFSIVPQPMPSRGVK